MPVKRLDTDQPLGSKKPKYKKVELSNVYVAPTDD